MAGTGNVQTNMSMNARMGMILTLTLILTIKSS
jgi:hypothetical protein